MELMSKAQILNLERFQRGRFRSIRVEWVDLISWLAIAVFCGGIAGFILACVLYYPKVITG